MQKEHVISEEMMAEIQFALINNNNWMAYNTIAYFLEKSDVYFFKDKDQAGEFAANNISEYDDFKVIEITSLDDVFRKIIYGENLDNYLHNHTGSIEPLTISTNKKSTIMNDKNFEYLKDNVKYLGFGEKLFTDLEANLKQGKPEFQLNIQTEFNKDKISAVLHFKKSDNSDMYFFNKYDAMLEKANNEKLSQTLYLNKGQGITVKESYNLLNGRAVNTDLTTKDGQKFNAWVQLDLSDKESNGNYRMKQFHQNYGYDLNAALQKYPIKELTDEQQRDKLIQSLQKGNIQMVIFEKEGRQEKMFIEANPKFKTINVYENNMHRVQSLSHKENNQQTLSAGQESKNNNQKQNNDDEPPEASQRKSRKNKRSVS